MAFYAAKEALQTDLGLQQDIMFESIGLNLGNSNSRVHSDFVAPGAGVYLFSATLLTHTTPVEIHAAITVNGVPVAKIFGHASSGRHDQGSQTVVVHLQAGDEVCVRNIVYVNTIYGGIYSSFSGVLLFDM